MTYYLGQGGWLRGLEPSLHDRPSLEIWPSETEYHLPSKQIWRRMQTWRDDEFLLGFEFSRVQTSRKGFQEHFKWNFWTSRGVMYEQFIGDYT